MVPLGGDTPPSIDSNAYFSDSGSHDAYGHLVNSVSQCACAVHEGSFPGVLPRTLNDDLSVKNSRKLPMSQTMTLIRARPPMRPRPVLKGLRTTQGRRGDSGYHFKKVLPPLQPENTYNKPSQLQLLYKEFCGFLLMYFEGFVGTFQGGLWYFYGVLSYSSKGFKCKSGLSRYI